MSLLIGARELGLTVEWRYAFLGQDDSASTTPGVVFIEIGGKVAPGVFDHHQGDAGDTCAAELVFRNRELSYGHLLSPWLARHEEGRLMPGTVFRPTVVTHRDPDWDTVVATFLVQKLIENGDFPDEADALVKYTRLVDQGKVRLFGGSGSDDWSAEILSQRPEILAPHAGYLAIQNLQNLQGDRTEAKLRMGLALVSRVLDDFRSTGQGGRRLRSSDLFPTPSGDGKKHTATLWADDSRFADAVALLREDAWRYDEDRGQRDETILHVNLPAEDGGDPIRVPAFVLKRPPRSRLNKYWVRSADVPFFICPYDREPFTGAITEDTVFPRVILSLDPGWEKDGRKPTLRGLGFILEREESRFRREGGAIDERGLPPRFPQPYCDNADPWYDGRAHDYTIVDSPMSSTVLPYSTIVRLATRGVFWHLPLEYGTAVAVRVRREASPVTRPENAVELGFPMAAATMDSYRNDAFDVPLETHQEDARFQKQCFVRWVAGGAAFPFEVSKLEALGGASLDGLVDFVQDQHGTSSPDYLFIRFRPARDFLGGHFLSPGRVRHLFGAVDSTVPGDISERGDRDLLLFAGKALSLPQSATGLDNSDAESFLYAVFVSESLAAFSRQIAGRVPEREASTSGAAKLREAFIRFQTRHYQIDVSRSSRGRQVFEWLSGEMKLPAHYAEVQSELDRLTELEERDAEQRRRKAESILGMVLFFVAGFGVLQTLMGFPTWPVALSTKVLTVLGVLAATFGLYYLANRNLESSGRPGPGGAG